nr:diguanylate cyclase [uncultured Sphaerochaeta sp.]
MRILHLDRSEFFQKVIKKGSDLQNEQIFGCSSIKEAREILEKENIELILTGHELEDGSSELFLRELGDSAYKDIPVIMLSSADTIEARRTYFELGVIDIIPKNGFTLDKLNEHIHNIRRKDALTEKMREASFAVVDDSHFILKVIKNILAFQNIAHLDLYSDPQELIDSGRKYDIYMIDMVLPRISGKQLVMKLRNENPLSVIIVISSLESRKSILNVMESGADDYILKPFDSEVLTARLKSSFRHFLVMKELEEKRSEMEKLAVTDPLTGVSNRRHVLELLRKEIFLSEEKGTPLSVMLIDIDKFKRVNDTYGHDKGDRILQEICRLFHDKCSEGDIFGRYGGEEFLFIMPGLPLDKAKEKTERIRDRFSRLAFPDIDSGLRMSFSGGLVEWKGDDPTRLLQRADNLMYEAKEGGRNNIRA